MMIACLTAIFTLAMVSLAMPAVPYKPTVIRDYDKPAVREVRDYDYDRPAVREVRDYDYDRPVVREVRDYDFDVPVVYDHYDKLLDDFISLLPPLKHSLEVDFLPPTGTDWGRTDFGLKSGVETAPAVYKGLLTGGRGYGVGR